MASAIDSGLRMRILRPCTLMIEQKLQLKGQPRPQSMVPNCLYAKRFKYFLLIMGIGGSCRSGVGSR